MAVKTEREGREIMHFYGRRHVTLRIFILGQCVALRIKNWQFNEGCIVHITLQQGLVTTVVRMLSGSS